jgi:hypothetical protein
MAFLVIRKIQFNLLKVFNHVLIYLTKILIRIFRLELSITNDTKSKIDGVGAQLQRLVSTIALCRHIGISFLQQDIRDVTVHPLDPFQDSLSKSVFVDRVNTLFKSIDQSFNHSRHPTVIKCSSLTSIDLIKVIFRGIFSKENIIIEIVEPYQITNYYRNMCVDLIRYFPGWLDFVNSFKDRVRSDVIYIHYRQGAGGHAVYPGQKLSRELPISFYLNRVNTILSSSPLLKKVFVFTDAPKNSFEYIPLSEQRFHWEGMPGFTMEVLHIDGNNLEDKFSSLGINVEIMRGGDPLEAVAIMSSATYLITSRSSLSYLAALFNKSGHIYPAEGFWHPTPSNWHS